MKYQWQVFLPSRENWLDFFKPFDSEKTAVEWGKKSVAMYLGREGGFKFQLFGVH